MLGLPGFTVQDVETKPDGRRYMIAANYTTKVVVSLTLEQVGSRAMPCSESLARKAKSAPLKVKGVQFSNSGEFEIMQYMVPKFRGRPEGRPEERVRM